MASVAETRAAIAAANTGIAEAQALAQEAMQRFTDAGAHLRSVRSTTTEPLGLPQVEAAIEACQTAWSLSTAAIEANQTYASML